MSTTGMTMSWSERLVHAVSRKTPTRTRRGFLGTATLTGAALAVNPWGFLVRPASAYESICGEHAACSDGYTVFCCTIGGNNSGCPPNSFIGGWWKADNSSFCGGAARYYIDCNAYRGDPTYPCRCAEGSCDQRRVACNQFRYGQCSLDIPSSQSGPVLCRLVSCTPPWQQFAGVCTTTSATDNRTATHNAPCIASQSPRGSLDSVAAGAASVRLRGWAFDPDEPQSEIPVAIYRDGIGVAWFPTGVPRADVNNAFGVAGNHGFDVAISTSPGRHSFVVYAINAGTESSNTELGSSNVEVASGRQPIGVLDAADPGPGGTVRLRGWAFDPDAPDTAIEVAVYRDGQGVSWFPTGRPRADVNTVFGISGDHGFDVSIPSPPGEHTIQVFGIDVGTAGNPQIGTRRVTVGVPWGVVDSVIPAPGAPGRVRVQGWAFDPDQPSTASQIAITNGANTLGWFDTGVQRLDVNSAFGIDGAHGFVVDIELPANRSVSTVWAINLGTDYPHQKIGTIPAAQ